jgi:ribosomal protein L33
MLTIQSEKNNSPVTSSPENSPGFIKLFACKCPRCRQGDMFTNKNPWNLKKTMEMNEYCPVCGQPLNVEVGFYFGSSYISYALSVALSAATFIAFWVLIGFPFLGNRIFYWLIFNALFLITMQPYLMRIARTGWLAFFVRYDPDWRIHPPEMPERTNKDQENNW